MKKSTLLLAVAIGCFCYTAQAQTQTTNGIPNKNFLERHLKPHDDNFTAEFGFNGGLNNATFNLNEGNAGLLRFRYFVKDNLALRLGAAVNWDHTTQNVYGVGSDNGKVGHSKKSTTGVLINLGIEHHFKGTAHLDPYFGGDILFGISSTAQSLDNTDGTSYVAGASAKTTGPGEMSIGLRAVTGADYYFAKHVYLGVELGLGFLYTQEGKTKTTITTSGHSNTTTVKSAGNEMSVHPSVITGIRMGFVLF